MFDKSTLSQCDKQHSVHSVEAYQTHSYANFNTATNMQSTNNYHVMSNNTITRQ